MLQQNPNIKRAASRNQTTSSAAAAQHFQVVVPPNVFGNQVLRVQIPATGQVLDLRLPAGTQPGDQIVINSSTFQFNVLKPPTAQVASSSSNSNSRQQFVPQPAKNLPETSNEIDPKAVMEVTIPYGITPGEQIGLQLLNGKTASVTVPMNSSSGVKMYINGYSGKVLTPEEVKAYKGNNDKTNPKKNEGENKHSYSKEDRKSLGRIMPQIDDAERVLGQWESWYTFRGYPHMKVPDGLRPAMVGLPPPPSTGRKKALLIGINYTGTKAALRGCVNDAYAMQRFLLSHNFSNTPETMVLLIDAAPDRRFQPTKENIIKGFQWLVSNAEPGDTLFFHYSGHGAQQTDYSGHERDGLNETILPVDFQQSGVGMITDDEIWDILVSKVPNGCRLVALMDCCHCGTGMDLSYNWKDHSQWFQEPNPSFCEGDIILFSGCDDAQTSADAYNKLANAPGGAMTTSFINCFNLNPHGSIAQFLYAINSDIRRRGFEQVPQLSSSQRWDPKLRKFELHDGIFPNYNPQVGKLVVQKFKPQKPDFGSSPLGPMLLAAGFAVLVAPALLGGFGDGGFFGGDEGGFDGGGFDFGF